MCGTAFYTPENTIFHLFPVLVLLLLRGTMTPTRRRGGSYGMIPIFRWITVQEGPPEFVFREQMVRAPRSGRPFTCRGTWPRCKPSAGKGTGPKKKVSGIINIQGVDVQGERVCVDFRNFAFLRVSQSLSIVRAYGREGEKTTRDLCSGYRF